MESMSLVAGRRQLHPDRIYADHADAGQRATTRSHRAGARREGCWRRLGTSAAAAKRRGSMRSASPSKALARQPSTQPAWTLLVSIAWAKLDSPNSATSAGTTADAENHSAIAPSWQMAISATDATLDSVNDGPAPDRSHHCPMRRRPPPLSPRCERRSPVGRVDHRTSAGRRHRYSRSHHQRQDARDTRPNRVQIAVQVIRWNFHRLCCVGAETLCQRRLDRIRAMYVRRGAGDNDAHTRTRCATNTPTSAKRDAGCGNFM